MLRDIILTQRRELENKMQEKYVNRRVDYDRFKNDMIKIIIGPRRSGKSFLGIHYLNECKNYGYLNFDDERLLSIENYDDFINALDAEYGNPEILLFDEIQNLKNWELFVNRLHRNGRNIIITGSNSKLLSKELSTHLTGRHLPIIVFPFSFMEFIDFNNHIQTESEKKMKLLDYSVYGGFPEPLIKKIDIKDYLRTLFDSIIYKDIIKRYNIRYPSAIDDLSLYLIGNCGKEYSFKTLAYITKIKNIKTIEKYIEYLEEAFIFFRVKRFSFKIKEQLSYNKKIYCIDNGLIYAKDASFTKNTGFLLENIVAIALKKKELLGDIKFYFWKNQQQEEVDFVVQKGYTIDCLIQVCYDTQNIETLEREKRALLKASKDLNCNKCIILNNDVEKEEVFKWYGEQVSIQFIPLWKWLTESENI
ncbi:MAG: ATP-binding protein [Spirochaetota bacterium]